MTDGWTRGRDVLPITDKPYVELTTHNAKGPDTKFLRIREVQSPEDVPNLLVILIDDVRFGASSAFAGGVTPRM